MTAVDEFARIVAEQNLRGAHWGHNGETTGVWGVDEHDRVTFVVAPRPKP